MKYLTNKLSQIKQWILSIVILRKHILPILIVLITAIILRVVFSYIYSILFNNFLAGWISCAVWHYYNSYYAR